jgi:YHS domain-containing protein
MKAVTWQRWISIAAGILALAVAIQPALASAQVANAPASNPSGQPVPGLPSGLPALPSLGETMQRDLGSGLALNGFDPVAYQADGRATPGQAEHELVHDGAVWRFASEANLEAFRDAPAIYAPAFAGFDPTGVVAGVAVDTDPRLFAIIGSRLFLFRTAENRRSFVENAALLRLANDNWNEVARTIAR